VVVENAGFGAAHAAPIARRVFDYVLLGRYPSEEDLVAVQQGLAASPIGKSRDAASVNMLGMAEASAVAGSVPTHLFTQQGVAGQPSAADLKRVAGPAPVTPGGR